MVFHIKGRRNKLPQSLLDLTAKCFMWLALVAASGCLESRSTRPVGEKQATQTGASDGGATANDPMPAKGMGAANGMANEMSIVSKSKTEPIDGVRQSPKLCIFVVDEFTDTLIINISGSAADTVRRITATPPIPDGAKFLEKAHPCAVFLVDGSAFTVYHGSLMKEGTDMVWEHPCLEELSFGISKLDISRDKAEIAIAVFVEQYDKRTEWNKQTLKKERKKRTQLFD